MEKLFHHQTWKRITFSIVVLLVLALVLSACGQPETPPAVEQTAGPATQAPSVGQPPTQPPSAGQPQTSPAATEPATSAVPAETTEAPAPAAAGQGTLRVAFQPIVQTDPANISSDSEVFVLNHVYDYLIDVTPDNTIEGRLATDWKISDDGLTYVFNLADGVKFHDGSPLTAKDVVWTFNRLRDPALELPTASLYANIASIEASGDRQVTFTLTKPNPFFLYDLSDNHALIMKADTQDPNDFNGTGPFVVQDYRPEDRLVMSANPDYFLPGLPKLASLEVIFFNDDTAAVDALRSGQIDLVMRMPTPLFESLKNEPGVTTISIPTNAFDLVRLRVDREPGNNPKVIEALKLATDRQAAFEQVYQGYGAVGRDSPIGPLYGQYYSEDTPIPARDPQKAKELLAEAGYPDGLQLDLHTTDTGNRPDLAVVLKNQWAEAGIDVNVIVEPESVYFAENGWLEVDLGITNWGSRPYPQFYLDVMLKCNAKWNESHFCDQEFDNLVELAGTTMDENERIQAYKEIQKILIERGPIIIPAFWAQTAAIRDNFQNFQLKAFAGRTDVRQVSVTQ